MKSEQRPLTESPFSQIAWPEHGCVVMILDGASIPNINQAIYEWSGGIAKAECLYASTRWEPVSELAPWLVWLTSEKDPIVKPFLDVGAGKEWGYFLLSDDTPAALREYLRQLMVVECVPDSPELLRIAHPELARSIIGDQQIRPAPHLPSDVVRNVISPDLVNETWVIQTPPHRPDIVAEQAVHKGTQTLNATFSTFNRRKDNLSIWELLDPTVREWLGGERLSRAFPALTRLTNEAEQLGYSSLRAKMHYLLERHRRDGQTRVDAHKALTFMDEQ